MVWPDTHAPYHSEVAVSVALNVLKTIKPDALVILGDFFDCYSVSRFPKDPSRKSKLRDELDGGIPILDEIEAVGIKDVHFLKGNHEVRIEALIAAQAPALDGMISIRDELRIDERGWHWTDYKKSLKLGHMLYSHDFGRHGVHAGYQGLMDIGGNICFGHTHKLGTQYRGYHTALNCGWLGDVEMVDYRHADIAKREYQLGFGLVDEDEDGCVWPQAVAIVNDSAMVRGRRITA
jgi:predicted phosphodiesterase